MDYSSFDSALESLAQACEPTEADVRARESVIASVGYALRNLRDVHQPQVEAYGSFVSGFYNSNSDLDLAVTGYMRYEVIPPRQLNDIYQRQSPEEWVPLHKLDKVSKASLLRKCANRLVDCGVTTRSNIEYVVHARVPLIKFRDRATGIECDLCIGNGGTTLKASFTRELSQINEHFGRLYRVAKLWAKAHSINDGTASTFNSWCLTLMVIFYLQMRQPAVLPPLYRLVYSSRPALHAPRLLMQDNINVTEVLQVVRQRCQGARLDFSGCSASTLELFTGFVSFMATELSRLLDNLQGTARISTWYGEWLHNNPFVHRYALLVEDPFDFHDNPARTFGTLDGRNPPVTLVYVCHVCEETAKRLAATRSAGDMPATLAWLFGPDLLLTPSSRALWPHLFPEELIAWVRAACSYHPLADVHQALVHKLGLPHATPSFVAFKELCQQQLRASKTLPLRPDGRSMSEAERQAALKLHKEQKHVKDAERSVKSSEKKLAELAKKKRLLEAQPPPATDVQVAAATTAAASASVAAALGHRSSSDAAAAAAAVADAGTSLPAAAAAGLAATVQAAMETEPGTIHGAPAAATASATPPADGMLALAVREKELELLDQAVAKLTSTIASQQRSLARATKQMEEAAAAAAAATAAADAAAAQAAGAPVVATTETRLARLFQALNIASEEPVLGAEQPSAGAAAAGTAAAAAAAVAGSKEQRKQQRKEQRARRQEANDTAHENQAAAAAAAAAAGPAPAGGAMVAAATALAKAVAAASASTSSSTDGSYYSHMSQAGGMPAGTTPQHQQRQPQQHQQHPHQQQHPQPWQQQRQQPQHQHQQRQQSHRNQQSQQGQQHQAAAMQNSGEDRLRTHVYVDEHGGLHPHTSSQPRRRQRQRQRPPKVEETHAQSTAGYGSVRTHQERIPRMAPAAAF